MSEDFYDILGVKRDATTHEIKKAYRKKAAKHHPDVSSAKDAEETFKKIKRAKEVLTDSSSREAYNQMGHSQFEQAQKRSGPGPQNTSFHTTDFSGGFGGIFENFFGNRTRSAPARGNDLKTRLEITLEDAYSGLTKKLNIRRPENCSTCKGSGHPPEAKQTTCSTCKGSGQIAQTSSTMFGQFQQIITCQNCVGEGTLYSKKCQPCQGSGIVLNEIKFPIDIPAGIQDGQTLRYQGEGAAKKNGLNGDLKIVITVLPHKYLQRDNSNIYYLHNLPFDQAVFGTTIQCSKGGLIPTLGVNSKLIIPPGTQSGANFKLNGCGMPKPGRKNSFGDQIIKIQIITPHPSDLSKEQKQYLKLFSGSKKDQDTSQGLLDKIKGL